MPKLLIEMPNGSAQLVPVQGTRTRLGRALHNDVVLDDPKVSRVHAVIEVEGSFHVVKDLDSKNGLYVDGRRVQAKALTGAASFAIGDCRLSLIADEDVHDVEAEAVNSLPGVRVDYIDAGQSETERQVDDAMRQAGSRRAPLS